MKLNSYETRLDSNGNIYMCVANTVKVDGRTVFNSPEKLSTLFGSAIGIKQAATEYLYVGCFDNSLHCTGVFMASAGSVNTSLFPIREIMQKSLMLNACAIAVCHNHPSGDINPSNADIDSTKKIKSACDLLGISFLDHVIVGANCNDFFSFATDYVDR